MDRSANHFDIPGVGYPPRRSVAFGRLATRKGKTTAQTRAVVAMVNSRASATRPRDSSGLIEKKIDPASAAVIAPSDAAATACTRARRTKGVTTNPSAP